MNLPLMGKQVKCVESLQISSHQRKLNVKTVLSPGTEETSKFPL